MLPCIQPFVLAKLLTIMETTELVFKDLFMYYAIPEDIVSDEVV